MTSRTRMRGFTLLEALVTLVIVSLLVATLMQALSQSLDMRTRLIRLQRAARVDALQQAWFRQTLAGAVADLPDAGGGLRGTPARIELVSLAPLTGSGLARIAWELRPGPDGAALAYAQGVSAGVEVIASLREARFDYLQRDGTWTDRFTPPESEPDPLSDEPPAPSLPRAVRLRGRTATRDVEWTVALVSRDTPRASLRFEPEPSDGP